jgi:arylsulfatase A-like enzyme
MPDHKMQKFMSKRHRLPKFSEFRKSLIRRSSPSFFCYLLLLFTALFSCQKKTTDETTGAGLQYVPNKPNIIVILADDMGYSDLGCMGSEIQTPHLNKLANNGLLFTHCYNASRCCPSRASLLTGLYQHRAGVGHMNDDRGIPAYQGHLNDQCVTIAEVLKKEGYRTIMSGKWHVGDKREYWPDRRGFERFYGIPAGGGLYFYPSTFIDRPIFRNGEQVYPDSSTFYSTDAFTDEAIKFVEEANTDEKPFFLYLAYIAPHFPLQAWPKDIAKYEGKYQEGYEPIRQRRFARQKELGIVNPDTQLSPADYTLWNQVDTEAEAHKMAVYAAQLDRMDQNIGKLIQSLEDRDELDNTVIFFLSDNGACAEDVNRSPGAEIGTAASFVAYGQNWANVGSTPYRLYKSMEHEGGTLTPLIVHWPGGIAQEKRLVKETVHINDIMPTCLDIAGAAYPKEYKGRSILPVDGKSFAALLGKDTAAIHKDLYWEHRGNKAVRVNNWKLVKLHEKPWELYELGKDPTELNDLSARQPALTDSLEDVWNTWAAQSGVKEWPVQTKETE